MHWIGLDEVARRYSVVIVGAGPGGLAAANALSHAGPTRPDQVLIVDGGCMPSRRARAKPDQVTCGYGGAGLFSDGKFSFYPSASELWDLPQRPVLRAAYRWMTQVLETWDMVVPPLTLGHSAPVVRNQWFLKKYPSEYLSLEHRMQLIEMLVDQATCEALEQVTVKSCEYVEQAGEFLLEIEDTNEQRRKQIVAERLIVSTGRFGPIEQNCIGFAKRVFRRLEVGIRVEQPTKSSFFHQLDTVDPKFRFVAPDGKVEWRTFCACREGATVLADTLGVWSVSGHSDCPPTGFSNCGFNTRVLDESIAAAAWEHMKRSLKSRTSHFALPLQSVLNLDRETSVTMQEVYGEHLHPYIVQGLQCLSRQFPQLAASSSRIIGPTLEGVGWYPELEDTLQVPNVPAWVVGDASGKFRGITAAMLSGYYAALRMYDGQLETDLDTWESDVQTCQAG